MVEMGEWIVGACLKQCDECKFIIYNQRDIYPGQNVEIDVLGLDLAQNRAYICEIATHLDGLAYGKKDKEDYNKLKRKFDLYAKYVNEFIPDRWEKRYMFWSPYVTPKYIKILEKLQKYLRREYSIELQLIINDKYTERVRELLDYASKETKTPDQPFYRALQILTHLRTSKRKKWPFKTLMPE